MAEILGIQIIGILFGFFMMYYTFLQYKRKEFKMGEYTFWLILWAASPPPNWLTYPMVTPTDG